MCFAESGGPGADQAGGQSDITYKLYPREYHNYDHHDDYGFIYFDKLIKIPKYEKFSRDCVYLWG